MKKHKKNIGLSSLKARYGIMFISPWILGIILFYLIPFFQSVRFSFSQITIAPGGVNTEFIGLSNYKDILYVNPNYTNWLRDTISEILYSIPIIIFISMVLAIFLNQKFFGRLFFRSLFFVPVIIATGPVLKLLFLTNGNDISNMGVSGDMSLSMFTASDIVEALQIESQIAKYMTEIINKFLSLIWSCGIQTVLFLAGLQSVPSTMYEVSKVEGATKWEEFWYITFPMLSRITFLVAVFTMVELIIDSRNSMVKNVYSLMLSGVYDLSSAMLWFYFIVCAVIMGIILLIYNRALMKKWEH